MKNKLLTFKKSDILIVAISLLMMIVVLNLPFKAKPFGDITFHEEAKNLALYVKGAVGYDKVTITKAPGPVFFYTPAYLLASSTATDNQLWVYGVVFTFLIITISMLMIFRIGSNLFSKEVGLLSVILFFIFPIHCYYSLGILAEVPAFFSLTVALFGWSILLKTPNKFKGWLFLILGVWFLILNRPNAILILPIGFLVVLYAFLWNKDFFKTFAKKLLISFFCIGIMGFLTLKLAKAISSSKTSSDQVGLLYYVAFQGRFQFREEPFDFRFWDDTVRPDSKDYQNWKSTGAILSAKTENENVTSAQVYKDFLIDDAMEHPFWFTRQFFVKSLYGYIYVINSVKPETFKIGPIKGVAFYWMFIALINSVNILIIIGAFVFIRKQKNLINYWPFWSIIIALLLFHGLTYMEPRYMFPGRVALYIMSAAGLYQIKWFQKKVNFIAKFALNSRL